MSTAEKEALVTLTPEMMAIPQSQIIYPNMPVSAFAVEMETLKETYLKDSPFYATRNIDTAILPFIDYHGCLNKFLKINLRFVLREELFLGQDEQVDCEVREVVLPGAFDDPINLQFVSALPATGDYEEFEDCCWIMGGVSKDGFIFC